MYSTSPAAGRTQSQALAAFALHVEASQFPDAVRNSARDHFLDSLGVALASSTFEFGDAVLAAARELGSGDDARAIGSGVTLPAASAALVNGTLVHGLDYDDTHIGAIYHASAPAFAAALATGQAVCASGAEVLDAYLIALEIGCRLAGAAPGEFHARGLHPTAQCGVFAAAAASARLRRSKPDELVSALGLAGSQASGILEIGRSWLKRLHPGWAAHAGLVADSLGRAGFLGPDTAFEGPHGFYAAHIGHVPDDGRLPARRLGDIWHASDIALKPYPCCHFIHAFVDASLALRDDVVIADIERIDCLLSRALHHMVAEPRGQKIRPSAVYEALFSVPYTVALALVKGRIDLAAYYDEPLDDARVLAVAERTHCVDDPKSDYPKHFPGEIRIVLKDGRVLEQREATSLGTPERPLARVAVEEKFMANASRALGRERAQRVIEAVRNLDDMPRIDELLELCTTTSEKQA